MRLSSNVAGVPPSETLAIASRAKELRRQGVDVVDLSAGEPDFPTAEFICRAARGAMERGETKYTAAAGIPELREAVAARLTEERGLRYSAEEVIVTGGAKQAIFNATFCLVQPGDEVLIPVPYWVSYPAIVALARGVPVFVSGDPDCELRVGPEELGRAITPRSRGLILNSPTNPTGTLYGREELRAIADLCEERGLWAISDEIYEKIVYEGEAAPSLVAAAPGLRPRAVIVGGLSKAFAMTGWRIGYAAAPAELVRAMATLQSHVTSHASSISQHAALAALTGGAEARAAVERMLGEFDQRRRFLWKRLVVEGGLSAIRPRGAFYLFVRVDPFFGRSSRGHRVVDSLTLCAFLLEEMRVALVPGSAFGLEGYVRLSYAASLDRIAEGASRIREGLDRLQ